MNFKKILKTVVAGLSVFAMVGTASAAITSDINLYGASAQYTVWTTNAGPYMTSQGCSNVASANLGDGKNAIVKGTCSGVDRYFRISSKASYDGALAIQGNTTNPFRVNECASPYERKMIDEASCNFGTGVCTATRCLPVTIGASDVPVGCFKQESHGLLKGPLGGVQTDRNFKANPITWTGAEPCKPLVVPFAFFAHNDITKAGGAPIDNITKDNAEIIFNGQVYDWSDMVDESANSYNAKVIAVCLRHAGSGTHASIDAYLSSPLINTQEVAADHYFYFNDGSSDLMKCVNGSGSWTGAGAIGYADADQTIGSNTVLLDLNGITPDATELPNAIADGAYNFYGLQQLYGITAADPLCTYASNPLNISNPVWVAKCKLNFNRVNGCESWPLQFVGATCP